MTRCALDKQGCLATTVQGEVVHDASAEGTVGQKE